MPVASFSGLASGIDSESLIQAYADSRRLTIAPQEEKIEFNNSETDALSEFSSMLLGFRDELAELSNISGGAIRKSASVNNSSALEVSVGSDALSSTTSLSILNLARAATVSFSNRFTQVDEALMPELEGTREIGLKLGRVDSLTEYSIEIDKDTSISDIANQISQKTGGKVEASLVKTGSDEGEESFAFLLRGSDVGEEKGSVELDIPQDILDAGFFQDANVEQAEDAVVSVSGLGQVSRPTNQITDLFPGMTIELKSESTLPIEITVSNDANKTAEKVESIIEKLNELKAFSEDNSKIERIAGSSLNSNAFGFLARTRIDEQAFTSIRQKMSERVEVAENATVHCFADLGVTTQKDGSYKFDLEKFEEAMAEDPASVNTIIASFADKITSVRGVVAEYTRFDGHLKNAMRANEKENENYQKQIDRMDDFLTRQEDSLKQTFTSLESNISKLNSQGASLMSMLGGVGGG